MRRTIFVSRAERRTFGAAATRIVPKFSPRSPGPLDTADLARPMHVESREVAKASALVRHFGDPGTMR
jgi:hypothetical protein